MQIGIWTEIEKNILIKVPVLTLVAGRLIIYSSKCSFTIWGRNGFDGDFEVYGSIPSVLSTRKLGRILK